MRVRWIIAAAAALGMIASATVGLASYSEEVTRVGVETSLAARDPGVGAALRRAILAGPTNLAGAQSWHAAAQEAVAWAEAVNAFEAGDRAAAMRSVGLSARSLRGAPVNPGGWLRLAALGASGIETPCSPTACYENSLLVAPMGVIGTAVACDRVRIGVYLGEVRGATDLPVRLLMQSERVALRRNSALATCLDGLPEAEVKAALATIGR